MPTVVLLDVSLSMSRPVPTTDPTENHTRLTIAAAAINSFLDYLSVHSKLEYVALVTFSSLYECKYSCRNITYFTLNFFSLALPSRFSTSTRNHKSPKFFRRASDRRHGARRLAITQTIPQSVEL